MLVGKKVAIKGRIEMWWFPTQMLYHSLLQLLANILNYTVKMDHQQAPNGDSIQVVVRIRPGSDDEALLYTNNQIKLDKHTFAFDRVFGPSAQQDDLFAAVGKKVLTHTLQGYNSCIFVYGQTGSGKTFTMMGNNNGMMQRSFIELFARIDRMADAECIVSCSYFQLYNQQIIDLLDRGKEKRNLNIRQDVKKGVFIQNLTEESALNAQKLIDCLNTGMKNRHIGETQMNRQSSRSHSIYTISLAIKLEVDGKKVLKTPKLHFVDLAGSERQKMTMATGDRLKEAGNINKSLTTLGMVINALASDKPKVHIPYRDSKLTCLLRDSLGGNSKTFIVATISTSILCFQQTLSTLNFANRAKMVKVKALVNQQSLSTNLEQYKQEIRKLKQQIQKLRSEKRMNFQSITQSVISKNSVDLSHKFQLITSKIEDLKSNMKNNSMESMESLLQKLQRGHSQQMIDEIEKYSCQNQMVEQGNELIQYMISNHQLLKKIHSTMSEYRDLKQQIKNVEIHQRMPRQEMKTPSRFERDQYQQLIIKRQNHIKELEDKIVSLKQINYKREAQIKDNKKKLALSNIKTQEGQQISRIRKQLEEQQKRFGELQLKYEIVQEDRASLKTYQLELQNRLKQTKQLYLYSEEKWQNQKFIRSKLQSTYKELSKRYQHLEVQKSELQEQLNCKIENLLQKVMEYERREEDLKSQQQILNQTLEFNKRKMRQYGDKLQQANKQLQQSTLATSKLTQKLVSLEYEMERKKISHQSLIDHLTLVSNQLKSSNASLQQNLAQVKSQKQVFIEDLSSLKERYQRQVQSLENQILVTWQQKVAFICQLEQLKALNAKITYDNQVKVFTLQKSNSSLLMELDSIKNWKEMMIQKNEFQRKQREEQKEKMMLELQGVRSDRQRLSQQIQQKQAHYSEMQNFLNQNKNVIEEHQQLKKTYKQILKQNYKLKGQYLSSSSNEMARNQELVSKVSFYQEKFRLMSIQYNKVQETTKKLKQKELALMKKIQFFEQNEMLKKINNSTEAEEVKSQNMKSLQIENEQLKDSLTKMTSMYQNLLNHDKKQDYSKRLSVENERYELEQKEEKIRKRLESAIKNWDHVKENSCSGMNLDQLFKCWEKIEAESRKKFQGIAKAIKRQQKLKSQNSYILKENFFFKQRIDSLQKQINVLSYGNTRKVIKPNQDLDTTNI